MSEGHQFLAAQLERLLGLSLHTEEALNVWYKEAHKLQVAMRRHPDVETPHEIYHFYLDADIRSKPHEAKYRETQEQYVREFIAELRVKQHAS